MADLAYRNEVPARAKGAVSWGAIWAGMFTFIAIWSVFGILGEAIFASSANPNAPQPISGMSVGMGIWSIVLTIIAMYVAGRVTADLSGVLDRGVRIIHGMAMFGLSIMAVIATVILSGMAFSGGTGVAGASHSPYMLTVFSDVGWIGFACLFLGWLAAMGGASQGSALRANVGSTPSNVRDMRPAA
jgi:hypothetical protein